MHSYTVKLILNLVELKQISILITLIWLIWHQMVPKAKSSIPIYLPYIEEDMAAYLPYMALFYILVP